MPHRVWRALGLGRTGAAAAPPARMRMSAARLTGTCGRARLSRPPVLYPHCQSPTHVPDPTTRDPQPYSSLGAGPVRRILPSSARLVQPVVLRGRWPRRLPAPQPSLHCHRRSGGEIRYSTKLTAARGSGGRYSASRRGTSRRCLGSTAGGPLWAEGGTHLLRGAQPFVIRPPPNRRGRSLGCPRGRGKAADPLGIGFALVTPVGDQRHYCSSLRNFQG